MKWIVKIINSQPYTVTCLWNDGITRIIDLEKFLKVYGNDPGSSYHQLLDKERFTEVKCDGSTLYWKNGITMTDIDGKKKPAPLDIDPDVLFDLTVEKNRSAIRKRKNAILK